MHPFIFRWGDAALQSYPVLISIAFLVGIAVWVSEGRARGLEARSLVNLSLVAGAASWVGARTLFVITQWPRFASGEWHAFRLWEGGVVFLGGFLLAAAVLWFCFPRFKIARRDGFDTAAPALAFGHAIGRVGCFLNGCCYGRECDLPWAVVYTNPYSAVDRLGVPLHPTQLYECAGLLILGWALLRHNRRALRDSRLALRASRFSTTQLYLAGYGALRFGLEFTRGDALRGSWGFFSTSQWLSLGLILTALLLDLAQTRGHNSAHESRNREPLRPQ